MKDTIELNDEIKSLRREIRDLTSDFQREIRGLRSILESHKRDGEHQYNRTFSDLYFALVCFGLLFMAISLTVVSA